MQEAALKDNQITQPQPKAVTVDHEEQAQSAEEIEVAVRWVDDLEGLDEIDIANALSFPASDPPSHTAPRSGSTTKSSNRRP